MNDDETERLAAFLDNRGNEYDEAADCLRTQQDRIAKLERGLFCSRVFFYRIAELENAAHDQRVERDRLWDEAQARACRSEEIKAVDDSKAGE